MFFYLAARFGRADELREYAEKLTALGHGVTSRWLYGSHGIVGPNGEVSPHGDAGTNSPEYARKRAAFALEDLDDLDAANSLIAFTEADDCPGGSRGGRHVELGYAIAECKNIYIVGPRENVFCWLPRVQQFDTFDDLLSHLKADKVPDTGEPF